MDTTVLTWDITYQTTASGFRQPVIRNRVGRWRRRCGGCGFVRTTWSAPIHGRCDTGTSCEVGTRRRVRPYTRGCLWDVEAESWQWFGSTSAVEHRFAEDILRGAQSTAFYLSAEA